MARSKGEILSPTSIDLSGKYLVLLHPGIHVNTKVAYSQVNPDEKRPRLADLLQDPMETWKDSICNDFEESVFARFPLLNELKSALYRRGALYASMSGSGSTIYGLFEQQPKLNANLKNLLAWEGSL